MSDWAGYTLLADDLLLLEASSPHRSLVSGCATQAPTRRGLASRVTQTSYHAPPTRLVGIELNPGPRSRNPLLAAAKAVSLVGAGAGLASQAYGAVRKAVRGKRTKAVVQAARLLLPAPRAPRATGLSESLSVRYTPRTLSYPTSNVRAYTNRTTSDSLSIRVPFDSVGVPLYSSTSDAGTFSFGTASAGIYNLELDPNFGTNGFYVFGTAISNLSLAFTKWRLASFRVTWEPAVPTTEPAAFAVATTWDGGIGSGTAYGAAAVTSFYGSTVTPACQRANIPSLHPPSDWLYVRDSSTVSAANERMQNAGFLALNALTPASGAGKLMGFFRFSGVLEFADLGNPLNVLAAERQHPSHPSTPSSQPVPVVPTQGQSTGSVCVPPPSISDEDLYALARARALVTAHQL